MNMSEVIQVFQDGYDEMLSDILVYENIIAQKLLKLN